MSDETMLHEEQFMISYELLYALHWLLKHEENELSKLIMQAYLKGYQEKLIKQEMYDENEQPEDVVNSVVEFFNFLDHHVAMVNATQKDKKITDHTIIKTLDKIDPERFDYETIQSTVLATADKMKPKNQDDAKNLFLKELLRQWNPKKEKNKSIILKN